MNEVKYRSQLFISYAEADHAWVEGYLLPALGLPEGQIITQYDDFIPGVSVVKEFSRAVASSRYTLLVLTPAYLADEWSRFGAELASYMSVEMAENRLIPLVRHACHIPLDIKYRVRLDCTTSEHTKWEHEVARLRAILTQAEPPSEEIECPYPGMRPFSEEESEHFYGRTKNIQNLLDILRLHPLLAVIGPSGSGKSSLIFAGLVPALRQSGLFGRGDWLVRSLRPGEQPLDRLASLFNGDLSDVESTVAALLAKDAKSRRLLLIVDQFEELFTTANLAQRLPFQKALIQLTKAPNCWVILTIRADFFADLMITPIWPAIEAHRIEILPLDAEGLREAIVRPAEESRVFMEPALVERLIADAAEEPGILPLVQETLVLLWEKRKRRYLSLTAYEGLGDEQLTGLQVAMARRADAALALLSPEQQTITRRIFLRLVQFGEGRKDTRRQQPVIALRSLGDNETIFEQTLRTLTQKRLLTLTAETTSSTRQADIAHERLIEAWPTFQQWITELDEAEQIRRRLESKAAEWVRLGRDHGGLLDQVELEEAELWLVSSDADELGYSSDLLELIKVSQMTINPGWHRWGIAALMTGAISLAALVGWLYFYLQTTRLPTSAQLSAWLFILFISFMAGLAFVVSRRANPYLVQRLSHFVIKRRAAYTSIGTLLIATLALWLLLGRQMADTTIFCERLGYEKDTSIFYVAVINKNVENPGAKVFRQTLENYSDGEIKALPSNMIEAEKCRQFMTHRLTLKREEALTWEEVTYFAEGENVETKKRIDEQASATVDHCNRYALLAHKVRKEITSSEEHIDELDLPSPRDCHFYLIHEEGYSYLRQKKYKEAEGRFKQAIEGYPNFALAHNNLGIVYYRTDQYDKAIAELKKAVRLSNRKYYLFLHHLGIAYYRAGHYEDAEQSYKEAIALKPDSLPTIANLSTVYREWEKYDLAEEWLNKFEERLETVKNENENDLHFHQHSLYKDRGILAFRQDNWQEASEWLEKSDEFGLYFDEELVYYLAISYENLKDEAKACQYWTRYQKIESSYLFREQERRDDAHKRMKALNCY